MSLSIRLPSRAWLIIPLCAVGFIVWNDYGRMQRVEYVSGIDRGDAEVDAGSPTGYSGGKRWLIVPERNSRSYRWIAETQQMLARREWRVRHIDYENAPYGRDVHSASPYRWWLGLVAWCDHAVSGRPAGLSVERAALFADPLLHLFLLCGTTIFVVRRSGAFAGALLAAGLAAMFPLAAAFLPGVPDDHGLALICALWSVLLLVIGVGPVVLEDADKQRKTNNDVVRAGRRRTGWFLAAGAAGGCGLWVNASEQAPVLAGVSLGAILAAWISRRRANASPVESPEILPWRIWALGGATTCLLAYLVEYFPAHMDLQLRVNNPLYGIAWLGVGEVLAWISSWAQRGRPWESWRDWLRLVLAIAAVAALPVAMKLTGAQPFLSGDMLSLRLTSLPDGAVAKNLAAWIARDGLTGMVGTTCLPLLLLLPAGWALVRRTTGAKARAAIAVALGPVLVVLFLAVRELQWWSMFDVMVLLLVVTAAAVGLPQRRWLWVSCVGTVVAAGAWQVVTWPSTGGRNEFTRFEVEGLVERALAHWIAGHAGPAGAVILAPPDRTASLGFYGGLRGLGTPHWENAAGLAVTARIVSATSPDIALTLLNQRGITQIVLPSWDSDLDEIVRLTTNRPENTFLHAVHNWALAPWLRALPYKLPVIAGFEQQNVVILEVTEESDRTAALCRLTEYFVEMGQLDLAAASSQALLRYPANLGALVAIAEVAKARGEEEGFTKEVSAVVANLSAGSDRTLPWDRRVSLAVVLALGKQNDLAREQVRRCLEKIDETRIRSLTTGSLYHLLVLGRAFDLKFPDEGQRALALQLLPVELRSTLQ